MGLGGQKCVELPLPLPKAVRRLFYSCWQENFLPVTARSFLGRPSGKSWAGLCLVVANLLLVQVRSKGAAVGGSVR